jgi:hypothetical protein
MYVDFENVHQSRGYALTVCPAQARRLSAATGRSATRA